MSEAITEDEYISGLNDLSKACRNRDITGIHRKSEFLMYKRPGDKTSLSRYEDLLQHAATAGDVEVIQALLSKHEMLREKGVIEEWDLRLSFICDPKYIGNMLYDQILKYILQHICRRDLLYYACYRGNWQLTHFLCKGVVRSVDNARFIRRSFERESRHERDIEALGVDRAAIAAISTHRGFKCIPYLLDLGADVDEMLSSPMLSGEHIDKKSKTMRASLLLWCASRTTTTTTHFAQPASGR